MTLPTEAFTEVVAFLRLFDMSALMVTNVLYSSLAFKASTTIRCEKFPDLNFYIRNRAIRVYRVRQVYVDNRMERRLEHVVSLDFQNEPTLAEFIAAAFPNCIFMGVGIERGTGKHIVDAVMRIADSVIVTEALGHGYKDMSRDDEPRREIPKSECKFIFTILQGYNLALRECTNCYRLVLGFMSLFHEGSKQRRSQGNGECLSWKWPSGTLLLRFS